MELKKTDYQQAIIDRIKNLRIQNDITQVMLSKLLGISTGQIGNIESIKFPHKYTLKQIVVFCEHIDYPVSKLLAKDNQSPNDINILIHNIVEYEQ